MSQILSQKEWPGAASPAPGRKRTFRLISTLAGRFIHEVSSNSTEQNAPSVPTSAVVYLIDTFLVWRREHRAAETYEWYRWRLQLFCESIGAGIVAPVAIMFKVEGICSHL